MQFSKQVCVILATLCLCGISHTASTAPYPNARNLTHVLQQVYDHNPSLAAARREVEESKELYPQARSGWLPTVSGEASIYATDIDGSNFSGGNGATTKDLTLSLDQPIFSGGQTFAETDRADELIHASQAKLKSKEQEIFLQTITAYMNVIHDREILELRRENQTILEQELIAARERFRLGDITRTDVSQAEARLLQAKSEKAKAFGILGKSEAKFEEIVGHPPSATLEVPEVAFNFPETVEHATAVAETNHPKVHVAQYEAKAAQHEVYSKQSKLMPQVSAFASVNRQIDPQPGVTNAATTQTIGLRATMDFFTGGSSRSKIRQSKTKAKRYSIKTSGAIRSIRQEVSRSWKEYASAKEEASNRAVEITLKELAREGVKEEAKAGQRTVLDILNADQELIDARIDLTHANRDKVIKKFALASSMGFLTPQKFKLN